MRVTTPQPLGGIPRRQAQTYTVRSGDTLASIAERMLGSEAQWQKLYQANRSVIGPNPNRISAGMVLRMPGAAQPAAQPREAREEQAAQPVRRPGPRPENLPESTAPRQQGVGRWSQKDVEFLARALSAESRGEVSKYLSTGDRRFRDSVVGIGYVIARKAESMGTGIQQMIQRLPHYLSAYGQGNRANNRQNYQQFFAPTERIANWNELKAIAREALQGSDPSGIDPNHYYDKSIAGRPPRWARGPHVESKRIGNIIFVDNNRE